MLNKVKFRKGSSRSMRSSAISSKQAQKIARAISELQNTDIRVLQKTGKVVKLRIPNASEIYAFRVGMSERILFTPVENQIMVHDIVDVRNGKSMISLISSEES